MGASSCNNLCGDENAENEINTDNIHIAKNNKNNLDNPNINKKTPSLINNDNKYNIFLKKFEANLPKLGKYFDQKKYKEIIPEIANEYIIENPIKKPEHIQLNQNLYEMKPIQFENGNIFKGNWNENYQMDGFGQYYIQDGNVFTDGIWDNGKLVYGRIFYSNNNIYDGEINNSNYHGKGKLIFNNKEVYEGDFKDGEITGQGIFSFSDGTIYEGEFEKGEFNGHGIMKWNNNTIQYEGDFNGAVLNDYGKLTGENGEKYEGYFYNNYFNGKGIYTYSDGSIYDGEFEFGLKNGKGNYSKKDDFRYEGDWANNLPHGFGRFYYKEYTIIGIWRNGINVEISNFEEGDSSSFDKNILNFEIEAFSLMPHKLPNLERLDSNEKFGVETTPSYLNSLTD